MHVWQFAMHQAPVWVRRCSTPISHSFTESGLNVNCNVIIMSVEVKMCRVLNWSSCDKWSIYENERVCMCVLVSIYIITHRHLSLDIERYILYGSISKLYGLLSTAMLPWACHLYSLQAIPFSQRAHPITWVSIVNAKYIPQDRGIFKQILGWIAISFWRTFDESHRNCLKVSQHLVWA